MAKKFSLNRGLGDILQEANMNYATGKIPKDAILSDISLSLIKPNPMQPRRNFDESDLIGLSESIKENGLLQPILVYEDELNEFVLIAGERRFRATKMAGFDSIKAIIIQIDKDKLRELALIENIQREDLNPIELATCFNSLLKEYNLTHEELSKKVGKSRPYITNTLRLLELSDFVKDKIISNEISQGHAKTMVGLDEELQTYITNLIIKKGLSVQTIEKMIQEIKNKDMAEYSNNKEKLNTFNISDDIFNNIKDALKSLNIKIDSRKNKLIFIFENEKQITDLLSKINI